ncbi:Glutathione S-transferase 5 [Datura stramonium]|uniref:Glutathione S-transferase 5 n=1 Tax=Datura stramonium TaxID=4076 RepID=A0ABS8WHP6_DATST|nr:Glutathione S-transferase 5 [Datura stramonium]
MVNPSVSLLLELSTLRKCGRTNPLCCLLILMTEHKLGSGLTTLTRRCMILQERYTTKGEEQEAKKDFIEIFKVLEGALETSLILRITWFCGYCSVVYSWFYAYETYGNFSIEAECPKIVAWGKRCMQRTVLLSSLPDQHKVPLSL